MKKTNSLKMRKKQFFIISSILIITSLLFLSSCRTKTESQNTQDTQQSNTAQSMQTSKPKSGDMIAVIETNKGTMKAILFEDKVPETVKNFKFHAEKGNYDNTIFHRVIEDFMIQGGDFENRNGTGGYSYKGPGTSFDDEFDPELKNVKGALSMANRGANTNGSQFFIVHAKSTPWLDGKHSVFGQVYEGLDVLDEIATTEVGPMDNPLEPIVITKITIEGL